MKRTFIIGRDPGCDIVLADESVSRRHAELKVLAKDAWMLRDLDSSHGTYLCKSGTYERLQSSYINITDQIRFGDYEFSAQDLIAAATQTPRREPPAETAWAQGQNIIRCTCGSLKSINQPCKVCGH